MRLILKPADLSEIQIAFNLLKHASQYLERKGIKQWDYWQDPPQEKIDWVQEGFGANEFFFIKNGTKHTIGMVRIMDEDLLYWGKQESKAKYTHSLVVHSDFAGQGIGKQVVDMIAQIAKDAGCEFLRLDCDASNPKLCKYYINQGFYKIGEKKLALGLYNLYQKEIYTRCQLL